MSEGKTVGEAVVRAQERLAKPDGGDTKTTPSESRETRETRAREEAPRETQEDDAWEGEPGWVKQWKKPSQSALRRLARLEGANELLPEVLKEVETRYDYTGKQQAEFDRYRKQYDPYAQVLGNLEQRFSLQGVHPQTGLQQMAAVSDLLQRDPDQALNMLFQAFKPRDVNAFIQAIAKQGGVDLRGLVQEQPWVDPAIDARIQGIEAQNRQLNQLLQGAQQQQYQQAARQVGDAIQAFRSAKDEHGELKYPHAERLDPIMAKLVLAQGPKPLEELYEQAQWLDPEIRESVMTDRARKAEAQAIQDADRQTDHVEEAVRASRNVSGSKSAARDPNAQKTLSEIIKANQKRQLSR